MSITVTLLVFSGRPNPTWELTPNQIGDLRERLKRLSKTTLAKPPGVLGKLGYSGFLIRTNQEPGFPESIFIHSGIVDLNRLTVNRFETSPSLEHWLLTTGGVLLPKTARTWVEEGIERALRERSDFLDSIAAPLDVPVFDPHKWNDDPNICQNNNCYNYACDLITNTFAQPGRGSGTTFSLFVCVDVGSSAQRDGLTSTSKPTSTPSQGQYVALVMADNVDFHWYRLDADATWSQKHGSSPAINVDESNNPISDPETCDRGPYTDFCGYFLCIPSQIKIL